MNIDEASTGSKEAKQAAQAKRIAIKQTIKATAKTLIRIIKRPISYFFHFQITTFFKKILKK